MLRLFRTLSTYQRCCKPFDLGTIGKSHPPKPLGKFPGEKRPSANRFATQFDKPKKHQKKPHHRKTPRFQFLTGTEQAQNAMKDVISAVHAASPSYAVQFVNPSTGKLERAHLVDIVNSTDLTENGLVVVAGTGKLPLVKTNKVQEMIKLYGDKLAKQKEQELLAMGSAAAQRALRAREKSEKKKSATKLVAVAWNISMGDLTNQKRLEIGRRAAKGDRFVIYLGEKRSLYAAKKSADKSDGLVNQVEGTGVVAVTEPVDLDDDEIDVEMLRRHKVLKEVETIVEEAGCVYEVEGSIDARVVIKCEPKERKEETPTVSLKEAKRQRQEKRKAEAEKRTVSEEDLDAMYSMKIVD